MKFGAYVYEPQKIAGFDFHLLRVKTELGNRIEPQPDMYSNLSIFGDNVAVRDNPDWISQSALGPAKLGNSNFNIYWNIVCATQPEHRAEQLEYIEMLDKKSLGVWPNSQYFADHGHCTCPRCIERWKRSGLGWIEWRRKEVTGYVAQMRERVKKDLVMCIQPDPINSLERYGVDFDDLAQYADAFNVVMFSKNYATPWYWEMLTRGFKKLLKKPFYISLYVFGPGDDPKDTPTAAELLTVSTRALRVGGVEGVLYMANGAKEMQAFQKEAVNQTQLRQRLRNFGGKPVQEYLDKIASWEKTVK
ncbi:MAG: hypothetical protein NWF04_09780 [Candidatus Bathyarchaeota archaeon]|nr:hypothetical protein [Candidatus Bathyarchaeota archaeon]